MNKIYFTYRKIYTNRGTEYDVSYYNNKQYEDFTIAWLTKMTDWDNYIPASKITKELVPWVKWKRRAWVLEYVDWVDWVDLTETLKTTSASFWLEVKTAEEIAQWIRDNTSCEEVEPNKFLVQEARDDLDWPIEARYITID